MKVVFFLECGVDHFSSIFFVDQFSKNAEMVLRQQSRAAGSTGACCADQEAIVAFGGWGVCDGGTGDL